MLALPDVAPSGTTLKSTLANKQRPPSLVEQVRTLPRQHWLLYFCVFGAAIMVAKAFELTLSHVLCLGLAYGLVSTHHGEYERAAASDYDKIAIMWRDLPGPTSAFFLDANLIIFFYQMKDMGRSHESGWEECVRQVNELLRRVQESEWISHDRDAFYRASVTVYQRALFHFHALGFAQSEYVQFYQRWKQALPELQSLLWYHLETIRKTCGVADDFAADVSMDEPVLSLQSVPF